MVVGKFMFGNEIMDLIGYNFLEIGKTKNQFNTNSILAINKTYHDFWIADNDS